MSDSVSRAELAAVLALEALNVAGLSDAHMNEAAPDPDEAMLPEQPVGPSLLYNEQLRTLEDAYKPRSRLEYLIASIIALATLTIIFGAPGSLKSMLLADLAICIAAGLPWLPLMNSTISGFATKQAAVLWIDLDNGKRRSDERFEALGRARDVPSDVPLYYISMPSPWLNASEEVLMQQVTKLVKHLGAKLVVIDNLGLVTGGVSENDADMAAVMGNLRRLCEETQAAVVAIHHQRKSNGTTTRKGETLRGHSSIEASLDLALHVDRKEGTDTIVVTPTKMRGATFPPFAAMFAYDHHDDSKELAKARFFGSEIENSDSDDEIDNALFEVTRERGELNKGKLKEAVKAKLPDAGINRISKRIDFLTLDGRLSSRKAKEGSTEKLIRLP